MSIILQEAQPEWGGEKRAWKKLMSKTATEPRKSGGPTGFARRPTSRTAGGSEGRTQRGRWRQEAAGGAVTPPERVVPGRPPPWGPAGVCRADDLLASPRTRAGRAGGSVPGRGWHRHRVRPPPRFAHAGLRAGDPAPGRRPSFLTLISFQAAASGARRGLGILGGFAWGVGLPLVGGDGMGATRRTSRAVPAGARQVRARCARARPAAVRALTSERLPSPARPVAEAPHASRAGSGERASGRRARRGSAGAAPSPEGLRPGRRGREDPTARSGQGTRRGARPTTRDAAPWPGRGRRGPCCDPHFAATEPPGERCA